MGAAATLRRPVAPGSPPIRSRHREQSSSADVAQLVEQLIRNQQVTGSNPVVGSNDSNLLGSSLAGVEKPEKVHRKQAVSTASDLSDSGRDSNSHCSDQAVIGVDQREVAISAASARSAAARRDYCARTIGSPSAAARQNDLAAGAPPRPTKEVPRAARVDVPGRLSA